jgi:hypothetical protein
MSSLADLSELVGFFSYSRRDDEHSQGALSRLRARIYSELRLQLGRDLRLWQDTAAIPQGALWEDEIKRAIEESVFFVPIVTPSAARSSHCRFEFGSFLKREAALGRNDLVFPLLYITVDELESEARWRQDEVLNVIGTRQYLDWRPLRFYDFASMEIGQKIEYFCQNITRAMRRAWVDPHERQQLEEAEARLRAEKEESRRIAEAQARQRAEEERIRQEAEARRRADEQEQVRRAQLRARQQAEDDRREAEARRRADHERAEEPTKPVDLAAHSGAHRGSELGGDEEHATLIVRQAFRKAMWSEDPAVLRAFLDSHPQASEAGEVRERLLYLQTRRSPRRP